MLIEARGIQHAYGTMAVIDDVSLSVGPGEAIAIMAPVGSGKSTLLRHLLALEVPSAGTVEPHFTPSQVGVAFQEDNLLPWLSVLENCALLHRLHGRVWSGEELDGLMGELGIGEFAFHLPYQLSSGMKQIVAIIRLLLFGPRLYVLDETLAHMDELSRQRVCALLVKALGVDGAGIVMVTHNPTDALSVADRILIGSRRPLRIVAVVDNLLSREERIFGARSPVFRNQLDDLLRLLTAA